MMALAALLLLGGCYSFRGQTAGSIKSIAVPTFENESTEFGLAERVTEELVRAFQREGVVRISSSDQADAVLQGRIVRVEDVPYTARSTGEIQVEEYRFSMTCQVVMVNTQTQEELWSQPFTAWAIYPYTGSLENRDQAIQEAVGKLEQDLLNRIVGSW
jgi:outer membrane lipopolysaccharide assembly protein LptE/RlpB